MLCNSATLKVPALPASAVKPQALWIAGGLALAGALLALLSQPTAPRAPAPATSASAASSARSRPGAPVEDAARYAAAIDQLETWLTSATRESRDPWTLAVATRSLGPNHALGGQATASTLRSVLAVLPASAEQPGLSGVLPSGVPVLAVAVVLLEAGTALDEPIWPAWTLRQWLQHELQQPISSEQDDTGLVAPWQIEALTLGLEPEQQEGKAAALQNLEEQLDLALARLERGQRVFDPWLGRGAQGMQDASAALVVSLRERTGLYRLSGWGWRLSQSVLRAVAALRPLAALPRQTEEAAQRLVGALVVRQRFEQQVWQRRAASEPEESLRPELVRYCGLTLEALGWALLATGQRPGPPSNDPGARCARLLIELTPSITAQPPAPPDGSSANPALEAVGEALRGLRMRRRQLWPK